MVRISGPGRSHYQITTSLQSNLGETPAIRGGVSFNPYEWSGLQLAGFRALCLNADIWERKTNAWRERIEASSLLQLQHVNQTNQQSEARIRDTEIQFQSFSLQKLG